MASPQFVLERIDLQANSHWSLDTDRETWVLVIEGNGRIGSTKTTVGDAVSVEADSAGIEVGPGGMSCLIAYPGPDPIASLLQDSAGRTTKSAVVHAPTSRNTIEVQT